MKDQREANFHQKPPQQQDQMLISKIPPPLRLSGEAGWLDKVRC